MKIEVEEVWQAVKIVILPGEMQLNRESILLDDGRRIS
jgi:hypothetical protein